MIPVWPEDQIDEAVAALARQARLVDEMPRARLVRDARRTKLEEAVHAAAGRLGIEAEPIEVRYPVLDRLLAGAGPALFAVAGSGIIVLLRGRGRSVEILEPGGECVRVPRAAMRAGLAMEASAPHIPAIEHLLDQVGVPSRRRAGVRESLLSRRLGEKQLGTMWALRLPPGAPAPRVARQGQLALRATALVLAEALYLLAWLASWALLGRAALSGELDPGWLTAWVLLLATLVPFQLAVTWLGGWLAFEAGALLKHRLLAGSLELTPEEVRHQGAGQQLGRVLECEAIERLALGGGIAGAVALVELAFAAMVLAHGASGTLEVILLGVWVAVCLLLGQRYLVRRRGWTEQRIELTTATIERMVGHRTRLVQEPPEARHLAEDQDLERYVTSSRALDRAAVSLSLVSRGWLVLAVPVLLPAFVWGKGSSLAVAISVGGLLLAARAFERMSRGLVQLAGARVAWQQAGPLFHAASRARPAGTVGYAPSSAPAASTPLVEAHGLEFAYPRGGRPVLHECSLELTHGDRLLLEGPSGGGKSTLVSLLAGLREPTAGLLLLGGLDRRTLGTAAWRRTVVAAPQFHENHVLMASLCFNLLMGRGWPPRPDDVHEAEAVCRALDLGPLLDAMPGGLHQLVGETGWQLSHGERSRIYLARALLQGASVVILDESFAALDPSSLEHCVRCALDRAPSLLVIAHP